MLFAETEVIKILGICVPIGGAFVTWMVVSFVENWRKAKVSEHRAVLVQNMIDKGFSPGEIERVMVAADAGRGKASCKSARRAAEHANS
jgi:uncharacterized membrane protein